MRNIAKVPLSLKLCLKPGNLRGGPCVSSSAVEAGITRPAGVMDRDVREEVQLL